MIRLIRKGSTPHIDLPSLTLADAILLAPHLVRGVRMVEVEIVERPILLGADVPRASATERAPRAPKVATDAAVVAVVDGLPSGGDGRPAHAIFAAGLTEAAKRRAIKAGIAQGRIIAEGAGRGIRYRRA